MIHTGYVTELENQIKSNRSLIYLMTHEEHRVVDTIQSISCNRTKPWSFVFWDISDGVTTNSNSYAISDNPDQLEILSWFSQLVVEKNDFCILVLHDFYKFLAPDGNPGQVEITTVRALKNLIEKCNIQRKCVILTGAKFFVPIELDKLVYLIDWPLPDNSLISEKILLLMDYAKKNENLTDKFKTNYSKNEIDDIIRAFQGLSLREIEMICTYFFLTEKELCPVKISSKKQTIIKKSGILEWIDIDWSLDQVGGLANLKQWLQKRKLAFSDNAKKYGLPDPKGVLLVGIQGAGKSIASKSIASFWSLPLLRLDMGRVFSGIVGSSEENLRTVIKTAESVAPCILWCDEIDKAFSNMSFSTDSGTSSRIFGTFLTWMQEKKSQVFIVATANDVKKLPPELIRKGRFDDIFFVDLPNEEEREEIWRIHLGNKDIKFSKTEINKLVLHSNGFTGAEILAAIESAMYESFSDNERKVLSVDIIKELKESVPIYITMKEEIESLRQWAQNRARKASLSSVSVIVETQNEEITKQEDEIL